MLGTYESAEPKAQFYFKSSSSRIRDKKRQVEELFPNY